MQQCHLVIQPRDSRALGLDARSLQHSSKGQRLVGFLHLTASHTQPTEALKMKQLCAELEKYSKTLTQHFIYCSRKHGCGFHPKKANFCPHNVNVAPHHSSC